MDNDPFIECSIYNIHVYIEKESRDKTIRCLRLYFTRTSLIEEFSLYNNLRTIMGGGSPMNKHESVKYQLSNCLLTYITVINCLKNLIRYNSNYQFIENKTIPTLLASIYNSSIRESYIPEIWKTAKVTPVPKVSPPQILEKHLRPISLTPVMCKQLKSFIYEWLLEIIADNLDPNQFGALKGSSTVHPLLTMVNDWYKQTDDSRKGNIVRILLIDYAKAFDRINPHILINKLRQLSVPEFLINWISAFLSNRRQGVSIGTFQSSILDIWGNVPQGTLLGILLFLIMINDPYTELPTIKFVDDTTLYEVC